MHLYRDSMINTDEGSEWLGGFTHSGGGGVQEWIATLGTEEMMLVIRSFTQCVVVEADKPLLNDGSLAVITSGSEVLQHVISAASTKRN